MKKLRLTQDEKNELLKTGSVEIERNGFYIVLEYRKDYDDEYDLSLTIINDYDMDDLRSKLKEI